MHACVLRRRSFESHWYCAEVVLPSRFELSETKGAARKRERQLKGWKRERKVALIRERNPTWQDLSTTWPHALRAE